MKSCCYKLYNNKKKICQVCKKILTNFTKKNLLEKIPSDIREYIIRLYLKSKNMFYYSNLSLVSKSFNYSFNKLYKSFQYISYNNFDNLYNNLIKSIYFVKSKKFNIKFAKLYFYQGRAKFNLLLGEENIQLSIHKYHSIDNKYHSINNKFYNISNLLNFDFIVI